MSIQKEGELFKYQNVVRGYQPRYFVLATEPGQLYYFQSSSLKTGKPKGSINLKNAKIVQTNENDSTIFSIHSFEKNIHLETKLKAKDHIEGNKWIEILTLVSQSHLKPFHLIKSSQITEVIENNTYECLICFERSANRIVVTTMCGHIFCKPCIERWIQITAKCPVCKSAVSSDKLVRLYGSGADLKETIENKTMENINITIEQPLNTKNSQPATDLRPLVRQKCNLPKSNITILPLNPIKKELTNTFQEIMKSFLLAIVFGCLTIIVTFFVVLIFIWVFFGFKSMVIFTIISIVMFKIIQN